MPTDHEHVRIAVLGDTAVGKTALCLALTSGTHSPSPPAPSSWPLSPGGGDPLPPISPPGGTVGAAIHMFVMPHPTSGTPVLVELFDLSGSPAHEDGRRSLLRATPLHAVWLVHDVTWPASRAALRRRWLPELLAARSPSSAGGLSRDSLTAAWRLLRCRSPPVICGHVGGGGGRRRGERTPAPVCVARGASGHPIVGERGCVCCTTAHPRVERTNTLRRQCVPGVESATMQESG